MVFKFNRDLCLRLGIVLRVKDYDFNPKIPEKTEAQPAKGGKDTKKGQDGNPLFSYDQLPFKPEDIVDLVPLVKYIDPICSDVRNNQEIVRFFFCRDLL
jgi:hypothetical protein